MIKNFFRKTKNNKYFKSNTYRIKSDFLKIYNFILKTLKIKRLIF